MTKREHLQFLVLMIPTFLILAAAAVSMADLLVPPAPEAPVVATAPTVTPTEAWDDRPPAE
jgi:hypothetical protein